MNRDPTTAETLDVWRSLAERAGLDATGYSVGREWRKKTREHRNVILRMESADGPTLIFKRVSIPADSQKFANQIAAQAAASEALADHPVAGVPGIIETDPWDRACIMEFAPGETLRAICADTVDHDAPLREAGRWLSEFHRTSVQATQVFQPRFMAGHLSRIADQVVRGRRRIRDPETFVAHVARLGEMAADFGGRESVVAAKHGDLNTHNLLIDSGRVWGIDLGGQPPAPVGYDIARFLLSYAGSAGDLDRVEPGTVVGQGTLEAFFGGYDLVGPDDPGVGFLLRVQVLTDWNRLGNNRGVLASVRFARIRELARLAFAK